MSGLMTPESLSRESSPAPNVAEQITLHAAPVGADGETPQIVGSHLEVKTTTFTPSQSKSDYNFLCTDERPWHNTRPSRDPHAHCECPASDHWTGSSAQGACGPARSPRGLWTSACKHGSGCCGSQADCTCTERDTPQRQWQHQRHSASFDTYGRAEARRYVPKLCTRHSFSTQYQVPLQYNENKNTFRLSERIDAQKLLSGVTLSGTPVILQTTR